MNIQRYYLNYTIDELNKILAKAAVMEEYDDTEIQEILKDIKSNLNLLKNEINNLSEKTKIIEISFEDTDVLYDYLPNNNTEIRISSAVSSIDFSNLNEESGSISNDYWVLFVFSKSLDNPSIEDLIKNSEIKILNPDLDISSYSTIHLLFTYDGVSICCMVAGY